MLLVPDRCWESIILSKEKDAKAGWGKVIVLTGKLKESNDLKQLSQRKPLRKKKKSIRSWNATILLAGHLGDFKVLSILYLYKACSFIHTIESFASNVTKEEKKNERKV